MTIPNRPGKLTVIRTGRPIRVQNARLAAACELHLGLEAIKRPAGIGSPSIKRPAQAAIVMNSDVDRYGAFQLSPDFIEPYSARPVPWGFGALSWVTYQRTYSREGEQWWQTCRRVMEGMFTVQRVHCLSEGRPWNESRAQHDAQEAFERLWDFKWTPPGRGLWAMGTQHMFDHGGAALNEEISRERYEQVIAKLKPLAGELPHEHELESRYCEGEVCEL